MAENSNTELNWAISGLTIRTSMSAVFSASQLDTLAHSPLGKVSGWPQSLRTSAQLVLNSPIPMLLLWGEQLTQVYNHAFAELAGHKHPAAFSQPFQLCWPEYSAYSQPIIEAVLAGHSLSYVDQYYVVPDRQHATERWLDLTFSPVCDEQGTVVGILMIAVQISTRRTALKKTAKALRELNDTLEERVNERTQALAQANQQLQHEMHERERVEDALLHAQKMEAVGQLTGGIAHDFNNMLTGIIASLDLMKRYIAAGRSDEIDRFTDAAVSSAQRAAALTHRLLVFSRRQSLDRKPLDPNVLVNSLQALFNSSKGAKIQLVLELGQDIWPVNTDTGQLESALLNLIINARDAMPDGGTLSVKTTNSFLDGSAINSLEAVESGDYVMFEVSDTGTGMSPQTLAKAFDPFFTTKPVGVGTGLGLSMIYGFAQQSGGHVSLTSEMGVGTCVRVYLPRHVDETQA